LFAHLQPFIENLDGVLADLRAVAEPELRIGGSELVLRDHVPVVMQRVRAAHPKLRLSLHSGFQAQVEDWVRNGSIDLAITAIGPRPPSQLHQLKLVRIPLVLLVHRLSPVKKAEDLWGQKRIAAPLVGQPAVTSIMLGFQRDLRRRGVTWPQTVEATSVELITRYVANGEGYGVNLAIPSICKHRDVRALSLPGFSPMTMGIVWRGGPTPIVRRVMAEVQRYSHETFAEWAVHDALPGTETPGAR
jgi:DNA-binding transcriptional LysR family regulator